MDWILCDSTGRVFAFCRWISLFDERVSGVASIAAADKFCVQVDKISLVFAPVFCRDDSFIVCRNLVTSTSRSVDRCLCAVNFRAFPIGSSVVTAPLQPSFYTYVQAHRIDPVFFFFAVYVYPFNISLLPPCVVLMTSMTHLFDCLVQRFARD